MTRKKWLLIGGFVALGVLNVVREARVAPGYRPPPQPSPAAAVEITTVYRAFLDNEVAANARYKGRRMELAGKLERVGVIFGRPVVEFPGATAHVRPAVASGLERFKPGDRIRMTCTVAGLSPIWLSLDDCE